MSQVLPFDRDTEQPAAEPRPAPSTFVEWLDELVLVPWRDALLRYCDAVQQGGYELELSVCDRHATTPLALSAMVSHIRHTEAEHERDHPGEPRLHLPGDVRPADTLERLHTPHKWQAAPCRSCRRSVIWAITPKGKRMPVDADPNPAGDCYLVPSLDDPLEPMVMRVFARGADTSGVDPSQLRTSHFATCPEADTWRRR